MTKKHKTAIELKYEGKKYADIANVVAVHEKTVAKWFMTGGLLHDENQEYERETNEELRKAALQIAKKNVRNAMATIVNLMTDTDSKIKLSAAKEIIEREFGKALTNVNLQGELNVSNIVNKFNKEIDESK